MKIHGISGSLYTNQSDTTTRNKKNIFFGIRLSEDVQTFFSQHRDSFSEAAQRAFSIIIFKENSNDTRVIKFKPGFDPNNLTHVINMIQNLSQLLIKEAAKIITPPKSTPKNNILENLRADMEKPLSPEEARQTLNALC